MAEIRLRTGGVTLVDDDDFDHFNKWSWLADSRRKYVIRYEGKRVFLLHREILSAPSVYEVDHINGNGLDNRRENIRLCLHSQNAKNRKLNVNNTSGFKGVVFDRGRWRARISVDNKKITLGSFNSPEMAFDAYRAAAKRMHGDFARI